MKSSNQKCLGPLSNLEEHLLDNWWKELFCSIYLKTDADVMYENITKSEVDLFLQTTKIKKSHAILDLACGQGRHSIDLAKRGFKRILGVDHSSFLIRKARETCKKEQLNMKFSKGDMRKLDLPNQSIHCVMMMGNSFGYFAREEEDLHVLKEVYRVLKDRGRFYLDISNGQWIKNHFVKNQWEWLDQKHLICRERAMNRTNQRLISREIVFHLKKGVLADHLYSERLYTFEEMKQKMEQVGFSHIQHCGDLKMFETMFQVGGLGMMAKRMIITASKRK